MSSTDTRSRYHGGWLAPNIYFLGHAGCVRVHGVRVAGASGIFKSGDFPQGAPPRRPPAART
jgi:lariat debranching enzyme